MATYTWTDNAMQGGASCNVDTVNQNLMYLKSNLSIDPGYVPYLVNSGQLGFVGGSISLTGNITSGSNLITNISSVIGMVVGAPISGTGIPANSTITSIDSASQIHISNNATATTSSLSITFSTLAPNIITSSSASSVNIAATATNILLTQPDGKQEIITSDQIITGITEGLTTFIKEEGNSAIQAIQTTQPNQDLLMDFKTSLTNDAYGNTVNIVGTGATLSGNQFVSGTNTGLNVPSITTLGSGSWCIEGRFTFNSFANQPASLGFCGSSTGALVLINTNGKSMLYLGNSGWNIASSTAGSITMVTGTQYHIALVFTGNTYNLYINGVLDQTIASSAQIITSGVPNFGNWGNTGYYLSGKMQDLRVTAGKLRYLSAFTPPAVGSLAIDRFFIIESLNPPPITSFNNLYWLQTSVKPYKAFKLVSGTWIALPFTKLGECSVSNGVMVTLVTYPFNIAPAFVAIDTTISITLNTIYKAKNNGFLKITWSVGSGLGQGAATVQAFVDGNPLPSTQMYYGEFWGTNGIGGMSGGGCGYVPVNKGQYFKVTTGTASVTATFLNKLS